MPPPPVDDTAEAEHHVGNIVDDAIHLKNRVKTKTKALFHKADVDAPRDDIFEDPAFDPDSAHEKFTHETSKPSRQDIVSGLKDFKYVVAHPRRALRTNVTRSTAAKIGSARHPVQKMNRDEALLNAHQQLAEAASNGTSICDEDIVDACDRLRQVEAQRESLQTAWVLGRHVNRVKVVRPIPRPQNQDFQTNRFEWERYLGRWALYHTRAFTSHYVDHFNSPRFDLEDLARIIERLAITSAPFQSFVVQLRQVYTWEYPRTTLKWLLYFAVLWYTDHVVGAFYLWIIYRTVRSKFQPTSVERVRASVARAVDRETKVQAWGELIQRHGNQDWIEPLLDQLGPTIQLQLGDLTDLMEVLINFHRHERPRKTMASLFFFTCCLIITLFADMAFCVKLVWFIIGCGFFFTYPIATRYPEYRLLLSQWRWMFWDIPTHAELAIMQLQEKAVIRDADLKDFEYEERKSENGHHDPDDAGRDDKTAPADREESHWFKAHHDLYGLGKLVISRSGIGFEGSRDKGPTLFYPFSRVDEILKVDLKSSESTFHNLRILGTRAAEHIRFMFINNPTGDDDDDDAVTALTLLLHPADRERSFNLALAWSGLKWQSLQIERPNKKDRDHLDQAIKKAF
ncbi:hypothetical protein B0A52_03279 [Exophiala mesophila]|uniref:Uncharacterized protein n=1 Tax=Exophiala mesophila TaxID=212818 RepID=A0A438NBD6_EXOME|nr:hypothetical protein B0A52_03279 [Exophiala mesophila]